MGAAKSEQTLFVAVCYARLVHVFWAARVRFYLRGWYLSLSLSHLLHPHLPMAPKCEPLCRFDDRSVQIDIGNAPELITYV